jgi:hypothetical protein
MENKYYLRFSRFPPDMSEFPEYIFIPKGKDYNNQDFGISVGFVNKKTVLIERQVGRKCYPHEKYIRPLTDLEVVKYKLLGIIENVYE